MRVTHTATNNFICKYYYNNVIKQEVIDAFPDELYLHVVSQINNYNNNPNNKTLSYDQFTYWLFNKLDELYSEEISKFKNTIKRIK